MNIDVNIVKIGENDGKLNSELKRLAGLNPK
jgi:hypothetical protein